VLSSGNLELWTVTSGGVVIAGSAVSANTPIHYEVSTDSSGTYSFFINGALQGTYVANATPMEINTIRYGNRSNHYPYQLDGWLTNMRITLAQRHTTSFTAPDLPIPQVACSPTTPSGNVWLAVESSSGAAFVSEYAISSWASQSYDVGIPLYGITKRFGDYLYFASSSELWYCNVSNISDWTQVSGVTFSGNGLMDSDGTSLYIPCGTSVKVGKLALPIGTFTTPSADLLALGNYLTVMGGAVYLTGIYNDCVNRSTDGGLNWVAGTNLLYPTSFSGGFLANNGFRLVSLLTIAASGTTIIRYSDDDGDTWITAYTFSGTGAAFTANGLVYDGTHFIAVLNDGRTVYSPDGASFTAGGTIPKECVYISAGIGKTVVSAAEINAYETTDHGASWTEVSPPIASTNSTHYLYSYWIGDAP
jgi:hypothetical protein